MTRTATTILALIGLISAKPVSAADPPHPSNIEQTLLARGLAGSTPASAIQPPSGVEVDEYLQSNLQNGQELVRWQQWQENLDGKTLQIQLLKYPTGQQIVAYWVMQASGSGCILFGTRTYNTHGEEISSSTWRNDPGLALPGGPELPDDINPGSIPPAAFSRAAEVTPGVLHVQISPYSVATLDVWKADQTDLALSSGHFRAVKFAARTDIQSILPAWPGFVLKVLQPLIHENAFYFDADSPARLLKMEGEPSFGGPQAKTELVRFYLAGSSNTAAVGEHRTLSGHD